MIEQIAIDLLWLRPGKVGGTESFLRNLLDGFMALEDSFSFKLLVSKDNSQSFDKYLKDERFSMLEAPIYSSNIAGRIIWQNIFESAFLKRYHIKKCFVPVYCKPWFNFGVEYICVIHDILAMHYPEYFPFHEEAYSKICWWMDTHNAKKIITISDFVREDIKKHYNREDIVTIYNPILIRKDEILDFQLLGDRYGIEPDNYYYTIAQLLPHKNLDTMIDMMQMIVNDVHHKELQKKLVITGVNGHAADSLKERIKSQHMEEYIIFTGFISNEERNTLYANCKLFLFPSVFEGFGMPPLEAMYMGTKVITTRCASIPEVTQNAAIYVDDPYSADEWIERISEANNLTMGTVDYSLYDYICASKKYLKEIYEV